MTAKNMSQPEQPASTQLRGKSDLRQRILVVDDEPDICRLSTEVLIRSGYEVAAAEDGAAAWQALKTHSYDLLITDHNMPKVTGVELLKKLHAARMAMPVILVTGAVPTEELKRHPWLQIDATLLKPYTTDELLVTVQKVLRAFERPREGVEPPPEHRSQPPSPGWRL